MGGEQMKVGSRLILTVLAIALLPLVPSGAQSDPEDQLISERLASLANLNGRHAVDCGTTDMYKPTASVSACVETAFHDGKAFHVVYPGPARAFFHFAYGLAGDGNGNIFEVQYDSRGLLYLGMPKNSQVYDENEIRVTRCVKPVRLGRTEQGLVACIVPIDAQASKD